MDPRALVKQGKLEDALRALMDVVRSNPSDASQRVFLFQLLAVLGRWEKSLTQLNVAADMDPKTLLMAQVGRAALQCEAFRADVLAGKRMPVALGEPSEWLGMLIRANQLLATGQLGPGIELRDRAFEGAPTASGEIGLADGSSEAFEWIADADGRLGPVLELVVEGRYVWAPLANIREVRFDEPQDLRDVVWTPATVIWANGGNSVGLVPTRYPGSESSADAAIQLARRTEFAEPAATLAIGLGQRMFATDAGDYPIMQVRAIRFAGAGDEPGPEGTAAAAGGATSGGTDA